VTASYPFLSRQERFRSVSSTNDIIRNWLAAGTPEVCLAATDEQTAGRGRSGRTWMAPAGVALPLSVGFRPTYLAADRTWRLPAIVAMAMADAAEAVAGLAIGKLRLKWPNDIVVEGSRGVLKVAGVLGETEGIGTDDPRVVVGIGINADWSRADFPADLADSMTSLREVSGGRPFDVDELLDAFLLRLEPRVLGLRDGHFDVAGWHDRQVTTGKRVRIELPGGAAETVLAVGVDGATGALLVEDDGLPDVEREVMAGEVVHVRIAADSDSAAAGSGPRTAESPAGPGAADSGAAGSGADASGAADASAGPDSSAGVTK
jgi:BirA family transcriptional regulator, biotin operon repressor / biotin---[acetyl-CoA-carboxylase] ligase